MTQRRYSTIFAPDPADRARVVEALAASIFVEWNIRNLLVWENVRKPHVRHWRDDCPALRRAKHAKSKLIPREDVEKGRNCGTCIRLDHRDRVRENERMRAEILALEPPRFNDQLMEIAAVATASAADIERLKMRALGMGRRPVALLTMGEPNCANGGTTCADCPGNCWNDALGCTC